MLNIPELYNIQMSNMNKVLKFSFLVQVDGKHHHLLSPRNLLNCEDIDTDLAVDFEGSFTGLGVELNTQNYSMSDQLLTINNIAVQQQVG